MGGRNDLDVDTFQKGTTEPFQDWESDHTALVHVLWSAKADGLMNSPDVDCDRIASMILRSRWLAAAKHQAAQMNCREDER